MADSRETPESLARRLSEIGISGQASYHHSAGSNFDSNAAARDAYQIGNVGGNVNIVPQASQFSGVYSKTPLRPVLDFVGRPALHDLIKEQLHDTLTDRNDTSKILVVFGLGGAGKSQLTLNYIRTYRNDYTGIFWIEAGQKESIERDYLAIYALLFPGQENVAVDTVIAKVKNWFHSQDGRWLFVFDSADTIDHEEDDSYINLPAYIPDFASIDVIITTRSSEAKSITILQPIEVAELELEQAVKLLYKCSKLTDPPEQVVIDIVKELGCLALAISLTGAYISETPRLKNDIQKYLPEYRERRKKLLSRKPKRLIHYYGESVLTTWESSFQAILKKSPHASQLLGLLAFLNPDDILIMLFQIELGDYWQSELFPDEALDKYDFEEAFGILRTYSLVQYKNDGETYFMHRLVHTWAHDRLDDDQKQMLCVTSLWLLLGFSNFPGLSPTIKSRLVPHIMACYNLSVKIYKTSGTRREKMIDMLSLLSRFLSSMGQWSAESQIRRFCHEERRLLSGQDHPDTLVSIANLSLALWNQGLLDEAEVLQVRLIEVEKRVLGQEHPNTLNSIANLTLIYLNQGRWKEAEELEVQVIEVKKRVLGQEHPDTLKSTGNLAKMYINQGRWKEAEELTVRVIEMEKRVLDQEHPDTLLSMGNLAVTYLYQGRWKEAEELLLQVIETEKRVLGQEHPETLICMGNLALTYLYQGRWKEAEELAVKVIETEKRVLGQEHPNTLMSTGNLAVTYINQGRLREAEELEVHAIEVKKRVLGQEHPNTLMSIGNLAATYMNQGRLREAEELEVHTVEVKKRVIGEEHPDTLISIGNLGAIYMNQGRLREAEELEVHTVEVKKRVIGEEHPDTLLSIGNLAVTYLHQGRWKEAEELLLQVIEMEKKMLDQEHPGILMRMGNLALTYLCQGRLREAEELVVQVIETEKRVLGQEHSGTLMNMHNLAYTWKLQGRDNDAMDLLIKVVQLKTEKLGANHPDTKISTNILKEWERAKDHSTSSSDKDDSDTEHGDDR